MLEEESDGLYIQDIMHSGRKYSDIFKVISFQDLQKMYYTLHEADITKFAEIMDSQMKELSRYEFETYPYSLWIYTGRISKAFRGQPSFHPNV